MERSSGILLHPTSLPGRYGIGTLGKEARAFIDFLAEAKQKYWQILPLGPTGFADSPYQCFSANAGNPLLIDPEILVSEGWLEGGDIEPLKESHDVKIDYGKVIRSRVPVLKKASEAFHAKAGKQEKDQYYQFLDVNSAWILDYALFMALKEHFGLQPWYQWEKPFKLKEEQAVKSLFAQLHEKIEYQKFIQYIFFRQWKSLKDYAHGRNIKIIGDIPLYVALDSVDAWAGPGNFQFDKDKNPVAVGGVPPDYFSKTGQLWGNPLYNWSQMARDGYKWWIRRIKANLELYDMIRIDHFRGLAAYWSVPYGEKTAVKGEWINCPGKELLTAIQKELGDIPVIAEDLGVITPDVQDLRDSFKLPGMKILQFAFDSGEPNDFLPHNFTRNCVVYTGTHDNETIAGWFSNAKEKDRKYVLDYMNVSGEEIHWDFIRLAWASTARIAIVPMQDLLGLDNEARMNFPGTTERNWMWRLRASQLTNKLTKRLEHLTVLYERHGK
ncbi:MAG TPA: 4-alpha-glucanotransferase [Bacteroidales bacterium]|nr:4-alpha-glucanotransferase [Bacteroidales bacterium]